MAMIEVKNLYKIFGTNPKRAIPLINKGKSKQEIKKMTGCTVAINGASFNIERKEIFVVMGLSGSGKSTFIRCLNRLIKPTKGELLFDGKDIAKMGKEELQALRRDKMSMVFQHFGLLPHRSVLANVEFGLEISGVDKDVRKNKAMEALKLVGLESFENSMPHELSGGMQQRVGLARALANDPEILLMDEAFSALDPLIRSQMQDELLALQAKMHKTIVFITHDLDEALKIGDRIVILGPYGKVRQIGTPEEILSEPADDYVTEFVQSVDRTRVITVSAIQKRTTTLRLEKDGVESALRLLEKQGTSHAFVVDEDRHLLGLVGIDDVVRLKKDKVHSLKGIINDKVYTTSPDTVISDLMATAIETPFPIAVLDDDQHFQGIVTRSAIIREVEEGLDDDQTPTALKELQEIEG